MSASNSIRQQQQYERTVTEKFTMPVGSPGSSLTTSLKSANSAGSQVSKLVSPMTTIVQLCLINEPGTKVMFWDNKLHIQPSDMWQAVSRTGLTGLLYKAGFTSVERPPCRDDYLVFEPQIRRAINWYKPNENEGIATVFQLASKGLEILKQAYPDTNTSHTLQCCIDLLSESCKPQPSSESSASSAAKGRQAKKQSSKPIPIPSKKPSADSISNVSKILDQEEVKNLWDLQQIDDISRRLIKVIRLSNSDSPIDKSKANGELRIINTIIDATVETFKAIILETMQ